MINHQWIELPMSRTIFYGPKDVRAIEVRLYEVFMFSSTENVQWGKIVYSLLRMIMFLIH